MLEVIPVIRLYRKFKLTKLDVLSKKIPMKPRAVLTVLLLLIFIHSQAQQRTITGTIINTEDNLPIPGATVTIEGTSQGTITDVNGNFSLEVPDGVSLIVRFVGMEDEVFRVDERSTYRIILSPRLEELEELVVIGYGTRKKRDMVGSVASVTSEELNRSAATTFTEALQGKAAGVQISTSSGVPGAPTNVLVRGNSSINLSTDPLWIVDGMPIYAGGGLEQTIGSTRQDPMSLINMNDIESIQVLKDAEATAIYGSRGSNGVILITTKSGKKGKPATNINYSTGLLELGKRPEDIGFTNTTQWLSLVDQARENSGLPPFDPFDIIKFFRDDPLATLTRAEAEQINVNWFDQILRTGYYQDVNVSSSGGSDRSSYYLSVNYNDTKGNPLKNFFKRYSARVNLDYNPTDNLKVGTKFNLSYTNNNRVQQQVGGATGNNSGGSSAGFGNANRIALPWLPIYNSSHPSGYWNPMSGANLIASIDPDHHFDEVDAYRGLGTLFAELKVPRIKGLVIRSEAAIDFIQNNSVYWVSSTLREDGSYASEQGVTRTGINYNVYANYNRTFGEIHSLSLTAGSEWSSESQYSHRMEGQNLTGSYKQIGTPQDILSIYGGLGGEEYMWGNIARGQYKLLDRYLVGFSLRRDANSKFPTDYRWHTFPALSFGWIVSEESFMAGTAEIINFLKIRGSFGETGNKNIPSSRFVTTYSNGLDDRYGDASLISGGTRISNLGTPSLTWETTNSYDAGVDFGFLGNRITGSVAYYRQDVTDLLLFSALPPSAGVGGLWSNIGDMRNFGWEFSVNSVNINVPNGLRWTTSFNLTLSNNQVLALTPRYDQEGLGVGSGRTISKTGMNLWNYYICEWAGVDNEKGVDMIYEIDYAHWEETGETVKTGRLIPATQTNLSRNRIIMEGITRDPTYFGGIDNTVQYKGFDLNLFFTFSGGNYIYDYEEQRTTSVQYAQVVLREDLIGNTWTTPGDDVRYPELVWDSQYDWGWDIEKENPEWDGDPEDPRATGYWTYTGDGEPAGVYNNESGSYSKYLYRGDYIRLRTLQLGYTFPSRLTERINIQKLRFNLTASNLWLWTLEYNGWDPESGGGSLPLPKTYSVGINLSF